jgi:hypothetical protein
MQRLSSDLLFHYKRDFGVLKLILQYGFRHSLWSESLPFGGSKQLNFMCCFCDILPAQAAAHKMCYGEYAIALTKEWGIRNGISPVRYVHSTSPGMNAKYTELKKMHREAGDFRSIGYSEYFKMYLVPALLLDEGKLKGGSFAQTIQADPSLLATATSLEKEFDDLDDELSASQRLIFYKSLNVMLNRISELHNELENRDAFVRAYEEDFTHPETGLFPDKILYDEREWRSIRMIEEDENRSHEAVFRTALESKFLPPDYNLTFSDADLVHIVVKTDAEKYEMINFISGETCKITASATISKICTFAELE